MRKQLREHILTAEPSILITEKQLDLPSDSFTPERKEDNVYDIARCCAHHWLQVRQPCFPGAGFNTCGAFGDGVAREPAAVATADGLCPACRMPGRYDKNRVRMIMDIRSRWRWGLGPSRGDPGLECCVILEEVGWTADSEE
ncbi:S-adenosylmethionine-dependent methyltransferase [Hypoxylon texense]